MERALQSSELLQSGLDSADAELEPCLQILLQIADSSITYRSRYPTVLQTDLVLQVLLADESNPRAVAFQLATLVHQITRLQEKDKEVQPSNELEMALNAIELVRAANMTELSRRSDDGTFPALENLVGEIKSILWQLSDSLTARYFTNITACRFTT
jgi:uncharacterized alpha-E superfamily protein